MNPRVKANARTSDVETAGGVPREDEWKSRYYVFMWMRRLAIWSLLAGSPVAADPAVTKRVNVARTAPKAKALAAWREVLAQQPDHSEALYQTARLHGAAKRTAAAVAALESLARSSRGDAIEWLVEARFDPGFASVRADAKYRTAVGLDRKPNTSYERLMGFGGRWEQVGTCGETPSVVLTTRRDRTFTATVSVHCNGRRDAQTFAGTWRIELPPHPGDPGDPTNASSGNAGGSARVVMVLPAAKGRAVSEKDEALCVFRKVGDEEALRCTVGPDLDFEVLPSRR